MEACVLTGSKRDPTGPKLDRNERFGQLGSQGTRTMKENALSMARFVLSISGVSQFLESSYLAKQLTLAS